MYSVSTFSFVSRLLTSRSLSIVEVSTSMPYAFFIMLSFQGSTRSNYSLLRLTPFRVVEIVVLISQDSISSNDLS